MGYKRMIVTMEDGSQFMFFKEDHTLKLFMRKDEELYQNEVKEGSIHAVVGEHLAFTYYYEHGNSDTLKTKSLVKEIEYR